MTDRTGEVLNDIDAVLDGAVHDWLSLDAMRWVPPDGRDGDEDAPRPGYPDAWPTATWVTDVPTLTVLAPTPAVLHPDAFARLTVAFAGCKTAMLEFGRRLAEVTRTLNRLLGAVPESAGRTGPLDHLPPGSPPAPPPFWAARPGPPALRYRHVPPRRHPHRSRR